ncbi:MAG TPA: hypothetical protein VJJ26_03120 [Candidatus Babeliales bacterium]|nr:hypothetical protein [Candidatus Babeliales bacterium]
MNDQLKKTLQNLEQLNQYLNNQIITQNVLKEEEENIHQMNDLDLNTSEHLNQLIKTKDINAIMEHIGYVDVNLGLYEWHLEQMRDITEKFMGLYREKNALKDIE